MRRLRTYILIELYIVAEEIRQLIQFCTQIFPDAVIATIWAFQLYMVHLAEIDILAKNFRFQFFEKHISSSTLGNEWLIIISLSCSYIGAMNLTIYKALSIAESTSQSLNRISASILASISSANLFMLHTINHL